MRYAFDHPTVAPFVAQMIPRFRKRGFPHAVTSIGVLNNDDELLAGIIYSWLSAEGGVMDITVAALPGQTWLTRETLRVMFACPFLHWSAQMVTMVIDADDQRALRQLAAANFSMIRLPRMFGRNRDVVLAQLTKEDWEASKFCQRYRHHLPNKKAA